MYHLSWLGSIYDCSVEKCQNMSNMMKNKPSGGRRTQKKKHTFPYFLFGAGNRTYLQNIER